MSQIFGAVRKSSFRGLVLQKIRWLGGGNGGSGSAAAAAWHGDGDGGSSLAVVRQLQQ